MRTWWAGILVALAALLAAPAASAQDPAATPTPTPTATPTPSPTPTPEEIAEAERKEELRKRKVVDRVYKDYQRDARIDNCDHSRTALKRTLQSITDEFDTDFPDFRVAVKAAIKVHDAERCEEEAEETPTPTRPPSPSPSSPSPTTTPAPTSPPPAATPAPTTDSGDLPDLGSGAGSSGGGGDGGGSGSKPPATDTSPSPTEGDVAPVQPEATPVPPTPVAPVEPQLAVVRPDGNRSLAVPAILLAAALAGLALLAATPFAARRSDRLAGWGHSVREATYRATGAWGDFGDWLRLGR
jgi:hypothetical protein